jgi:hypothetical protein
VTTDTASPRNQNASAPGASPTQLQLAPGALTGPRWTSLPAAPESVRQARRFAASVLAGVTEADADHVDDVVLVVSELITNAVREVAKMDPARGGEMSVHLGVAVHHWWTHLYAVDTAPALPKETQNDPLAGSGRGIPIIKSLAAMTWVEHGEGTKTIHVILTRTGVEVTHRDGQALASRCGP